MIVKNNMEIIVKRLEVKGIKKRIIEEKLTKTLS
jgi:hypothetical protein